MTRTLALDLLMEEVLTEAVLMEGVLTDLRIYSLRKGAASPPLGAVYVGRGTPWGNAYPMLNPSRGERDRVCDLFERDAVLRARTEPEWLEPLRGKSLTCWCKSTPESSVRCHAETLLRLANQRA